MTDFTSKIADLTKSIHRFERILKENVIFKGQMTPFKSAKLQMSFNELQTARMFAGDCLRLVVLGADWRKEQRFVPMEHGGTWDGNVEIFSEAELGSHEDKNNLERICINDLKKQLRHVFYSEMDGFEIQYPDGLEKDLTTKWSTEFFMYYQNAVLCLKKADQQLGLRLGELA